MRLRVYRVPTSQSTREIFFKALATPQYVQFVG